MARPRSSTRQFHDLSEGVAFIAECLESGSIAELHSDLELAEERLARRPDDLDYFSRFVFAQLCDIHRRTDLRELYRDRAFPEDSEHFKLGGHMKELGCIHIDFEKGHHGWALRDIWLCR